MINYEIFWGTIAGHAVVFGIIFVIGTIQGFFKRRKLQKDLAILNDLVAQVKEVQRERDQRLN